MSPVGVSPLIALWMTDLHLEFIKDSQVREFCAAVAGHAPDIVLVGGDTGQAGSFERYLKMMASALACPLYFVLGNHDFYKGSIRDVRDRAAAIAGPRWMPQAGVVALTDESCLIGHDGWADGRFGNYAASTVMLNDYILIEELARLGKRARLEVLHRLGDEAAAYVRHTLLEAIERYNHVYLLTHVPPFREACWHEGRISDDDWLPHMSCKAVGDAILDVMTENREKQLTVLCGHTHSSGQASPAVNVHVLTAGAVYGAPAVARIFNPA